MSPRRISNDTSERVQAELRRIGFEFGRAVRDARLSHAWSVADLAGRAGVSPDIVYRIESGTAPSPGTAARLGVALGRRIESTLVDPRKRETRPSLSVDHVHSAMGEFEAAHFRALEFRVGLDEPYQHYQFAGRADVVAWDVERRALLHIENRTRFPDFQEMAGSFNAKRAYLAAALADRVGVFGWRSQTHVIAALWSSEVLHALRLRTHSFTALCPDSAQAFDGWWSGSPPRVGAFSVLIVLDPHAAGRTRAWIDLEQSLRARPRYRGYAEATAVAPV